MVKHIRSSPARKQLFVSTLETLRQSPKVPKNDVLTRWNSTYQMVVSCLELKEAFLRMPPVDSTFELQMDDSNWAEALVFVQFMKPLNDCEYNFTTMICFLSLSNSCLVTMKLSTRSKPTASWFLESITQLWIHINRFRQNESGPLRLTIAAMKDKFEKYWLDFNDFFSVACILDPRYKLQNFKFLLVKLYDDDSARADAKFSQGLHL